MYINILLFFLFLNKEHQCPKYPNTCVVQPSVSAQAVVLVYPSAPPGLAQVSDISVKGVHLMLDLLNTELYLGGKASFPCASLPSASLPTFSPRQVASCGQFADSASLPSASLPTFSP